MNSTLQSEGKIDCAVARKKYVELYGEPKTRKVWERFSQSMRKKTNLSSEVEKKDGVRKYFWKKN